MAKASLLGLITQGPELQHSTKGEPYVRFSVAEYVGFGSQRYTQFVAHTSTNCVCRCNPKPTYSATEKRT